MYTDLSDALRKGTNNVSMHLHLLDQGTLIFNNVNVNLNKMVLSTNVPLIESGEA
jgi:hypothetical protein